MSRLTRSGQHQRWLVGRSSVPGWIVASLLSFACASSPLVVPAAQPGSGADYPSLGSDWRGSAAEILSGAIQIVTSNPPGDEALLAHWLADLLSDEDGVETRVIQLEDGPRAALWARVRGNGQRRPLILLSHLDTVPAVAEEWRVDPYAGVIGGGFVVGRGALDAKGVTVSHLLTLVALARRSAPLSRDVILLATPDEEAGGLHGAALVARDRRELLGDAEFLLTEGGGIMPGGPGQPDVWGVSFTEKTPCWLDIVARGLPGHGSVDRPGAAPKRLIAALGRLDGIAGDVRVVPPVARMFEALAPLAPPNDRDHYLNLRGALALRPEFRDRFLADPGRAALVQNTAVVTTLDAGSLVNVVPAEARATIDARLLPGDSCADFAAQVRAALGPEVDLEVRLAFDAAESPLRSPLMTAIENVAAAHEPRGIAIPRVIAGFTDAHWFRQLGITSYGFVPRRLRSQETRGVHGPNERISLDNLTLGVETLLEILEELER